MNKKIYIGFDSKESKASEVCEFSLKKNSDSYLDIKHIKIDEMRKKNIYQREDDKLGSTEFTFTRFLVPFLENYKGWALFCDSDFLWLSDVNELFSSCDNRYAIMCVHHDYKPINNIKKIGKSQHYYPRKNWSSMVLWNCSHPSNKVVTPNLINTQSGKFMHRFGWLKDQEIGEINHEWNWLIDWYKEPLDGKPKALHFTEGGPWLGSQYDKKEYSNIWNSYSSSLNKNMK
ncbi:glycosyltransferase [Candidatus Pelagibacter sp. Uisw_104]|jgi:lipopolysaccharide biosynthesis glycosyltransferase|uniref:glycosyltransferase n=1 Tax=unclassified Candidatus Pelagibacter TaxID=2647897 RepID=UPI0039EB4362|tara:strand:+ start:791 stop:1483 length:693 start_codon:yes stop_codon:yes gene_type:complete